MIHSNKLKTNLKQIKDTIYFQLLEGTQISDLECDPWGLQERVIARSCPLTIVCLLWRVYVHTHGTLSK